MIYKTMGIVCDFGNASCGEVTETQGQEATMAKIMEQARQEGWAVSSAGHFCPTHRRRRA